MATEADKQAQEERARRYGIAVKPGGNVTIPAEHRRRWPDITPDDYLDPVNLRYPVPNAEQTAVAARYWGQEDNRRQYSPAEQAIISRRLEAAKKRFKVGEYAAEANRADVVLSLEAQPLPDAGRKPPEWIQLLPAGYVQSKKGAFVVDEESRRLIIEAFNAERNDMVIDYEHQTLSGDIAPAAGWVKELQDRGNDGIWARVEWTERGGQYVANREYRYLSPVVLVRRSDRRAVAVLQAALTNTPAIDGMTPLVNKGAVTPRKEDETMDFLQRLRQLFALPEDADEAAIMRAAEALANRTEPVAHKEVLGLLDLPEDAGLDQVKGAVLALKNPSGYVRVEEFQALQQKLALRERDELVQQALSAGKITPAQKPWAQQYALKDPAGFKAFIDAAPAVVPVGDAKDVGATRDGKRALDEAQVMVNKLLGISDEDFLKYGGGDDDGGLDA